MTYKTEDDRRYWVNRYNDSLPQIKYKFGDEEYSVAKTGGIYDSAYMGFVYDDWRQYQNWTSFKKLNKFVKKIQKENEPVLTEHSKQRIKKMRREREVMSLKKFCDQQEQKRRLDPEYWKAKFGDCGEIGNQILEHYKNRRRTTGYKEADFTYIGVGEAITTDDAPAWPMKLGKVSNLDKMGYLETIY